MQKKYQKEEERITEIERANRILFEKMRNIKVKKGPYSQADSQTQRRRFSLRALNRTPTLSHHDPSLVSYNTEVVQPHNTHREAEMGGRRPRSKELVGQRQRRGSVPPLKFNKDNKLLYKQEK